MPMTLISRTTLTTTAASVTFNSIPQTYQTLKLVVSARTNAATNGEQFYIDPNTSAANFSNRLLYGSGLAAGSANDTATHLGFVNGSTTTASTFGNMEIVIPNYFGSTNKAFSSDTVEENNGTFAYAGLSAGLWSQTSSIVSLVLRPPTGSTSWVANSTFSLYGIA